LKGAEAKEMTLKVCYELQVFLQGITTLQNRGVTPVRATISITPVHLALEGFYILRHDEHGLLVRVMTENIKLMSIARQR
jgi:hypothetical protein